MADQSIKHKDGGGDDIKPLKDNSDVVVHEDTEGKPVSVSIAMHTDPRTGPVVEEAMGILRAFNDVEIVTRVDFDKLCESLKKTEILLRQIDPMECALYLSSHEEHLLQLERTGEVLSRAVKEKLAGQSNDAAAVATKSINS
jgi:hypothetical protein